MKLFAHRVCFALFLATGAASAAEGAASDAAPTTADDTATPALAESQADLKTEKQNANPKPSTGSGDDADAAKKKDDEEPTFGHGFQFGIRGGVVLGYKMDFRYDKSPFCKKPDNQPVDQQQKICGFGAPPAFEGALSFGVLDSVEPYLFGRFGFGNETATSTKPLRLVGVGARIYTMSDSRFKLFVEPALAYEFEGYAGDPAWSPDKLHPDYKQDLVFHIGVGPQYDFAKMFGVYVNAGIDVGMLRAISATVLLNIGVQFRGP